MGPISHPFLFAYLLFYITIDDILVMYVTAHRRAGGLKKRMAPISLLLFWHNSQMACQTFRWFLSQKSTYTTKCYAFGRRSRTFRSQVQHSISLTDSINHRKISSNLMIQILSCTLSESYRLLFFFTLSENFKSLKSLMNWALCRSTNVCHEEVIAWKFLLPLLRFELNFLWGWHEKLRDE